MVTVQDLRWEEELQHTTWDGRCHPEDFINHLEEIPKAGNSCSAKLEVQIHWVKPGVSMCSHCIENLAHMF